MEITEPDDVHRRGRQRQRRQNHDHITNPKFSEEISNGNQLNCNDFPVKKKVCYKQGDTDDTAGNLKRPRRSRKNKCKSTRHAAIIPRDDDQGHGECSFPIDPADMIQGRALEVSSLNAGIIAPPTQPSLERDVIFIEQKDGHGFVKEKKPRESHPQTEYGIQLLQQKQLTSLDFILQIHMGFRHLALLCHGMLAGISAAQSAFTFTMSDDRTLLENYFKLALPFQSTFYLLLTICTISILDRFVNFGKGFHHFMLTLLSKPSIGLALLAYVGALVTSVSMAQLDASISLYKLLPHLWSSTERLLRWKVLNTARVVASLIGWLVVGLNTSVDQTVAIIEDCIDKENSVIESVHPLNRLH